MINAIVGRPRAGKSYESVVYHILPSAKSGRLVVTNIPVNKEKIVAYYGQEVADNIIVVTANFNSYGMVRPFSSPEDFTKYDWKNDKGQGPLFVVDEAHLSMGRDAKKEVLEYLSLHGHYGHDIIVLTQDAAKLHKDLKVMVEVCWRCIKKSVFGDNDHYIKKTYHGVSARTTDFVHQEERKYEVQYFQFYQSHTQSSVSVDEEKPKDIKAKLMPHKWLSIILIVVGVFFCVWTGKRMFFPAAKVQESAKAAPSLVTVTQSPVAVPQPATALNSHTVPQQMDKSLPIHPFYKVDLHVDGSAEYSMNGRMYKEVYFSGSQNGQNVLSLSIADLRLAGYDVQVYSDCVVFIAFKEYQDYIICDTPQVSTQIASNAPKVAGPETGG
jgi:zona occludens toxin